MTDLKDLTVLVYDYGNFFAISQKLAEVFKTVYYFMPKISNGFPDHRPIDVGRNVPGVIPVKEWAEVINDVDLVYFPDCHEAALQMFFQNDLKKKVFGSRYAINLEHDRKGTKELMKQLDLPLNEYFVAEGMDELEAVLKENENVYVKSSLRGDSETFKSTSYILSKGELQRMRNNLGAYQNKETYIVEKPIESIAEVGIDTFCIDGMYPEFVMTGIELKDTGFAGCMTRYMDLPEQLRLVTEKFSLVFRDYNYRGWYSNEVIIAGDMKGYLIDSTCRNPSPPTDLVLEMITNYGEAAWQVASGIVPKIKFDYKWGVQLIIKSETARADPSPLIIPNELKKYVKVKNLTIDDDGTYFYTPFGVDMVEIGSVIGMGATMKEALSMAKMVAGSIKGFDIKINSDCIEDAQKQIDRLAVNGISYLQ